MISKDKISKGMISKKTENGFILKTGFYTVKRTPFGYQTKIRFFAQN